MVKEGISFETMPGLIRGFIADQMLKAVEEVSDDAKLIEDLGADSLDVVELIMTIEEEIGINVPDYEAEKIITVGEAIALVKRLYGEQKAR